MEAQKIKQRRRIQLAAFVYPDPARRLKLGYLDKANEMSVKMQDAFELMATLKKVDILLAEHGLTISSRDDIRIYRDTAASLLGPASVCLTITQLVN